MMRQLMLAAAAALALGACGGSANGPPLPKVQAGATPPSTQSPASPTEQTTVTDEVRQQLVAQASELLNQVQSQFAPGLSALNGQADVVTPMQPGTDNRFVVNLTAGTDYAFLGVCDGDCTNVDIELISMETGGVVANDMLPDDYPVVGFTPPADGAYMVRTLMQVCTRAPCYAGTRVLTRAVQPAANLGKG